MFSQNRDQLREVIYIGDVREKSVSEFRPVVHNFMGITFQIVYYTHIWRSVHYLQKKKIHRLHSE